MRIGIGIILDVSSLAGLNFLLSFLDHSTLCERDNFFLWDLSAFFSVATATE